MCSALHPHTGTCDRTHTRQSPMRALPSHTERAVHRFFFSFFFFSMRLKSLMEWTARGSRGRGVGVGGQRSAESDEADDCACRNRRPEHQSGVSRWRSGRSGWKGQRVRWADKLIFVVVHAPSRARARARKPSSPGYSKARSGTRTVALWRTLVVHVWGAGRKETLLQRNFRPTARTVLNQTMTSPSGCWWRLIIDCHFLVGVMIYCISL